MKKFLLHTTKFGLIIFLLINAVAWFNLYFIRNSSFYKPSFLTHEVKETQLDYIIIGSSIGLTSLNSTQIDSITHKKGLNLSIDDTALCSNYLMLSHFYNQGRKTNYCILAISHWDLANAEPELSDNDYRFLPFVSEKYVQDYYASMEKGYFKPLSLSRYFPAIGVSYYNTELFYPSLLAMMQPNKRNRFDEKGNYAYPINSDFEDETVEQTPLTWNNPFIKKIKDLCEANNTQLIVYQAPMYQNTTINNNSNYTFINHSTLLKDKSYFYDKIHLNASGRKIASEQLALELNQNFFK